MVKNEHEGWFDRSRSGFSLVDVAIVAVLVSLLLLIVIPTLMQFQLRARQAEARTNLSAVFTAQSTHFGEHRRYEANVELLGFLPDRGNRYAYYVGGTGDHIDRRGPEDEKAGQKPEWITRDTNRHGGTHNPHEERSECNPSWAFMIAHPKPGAAVPEGFGLTGRGTEGNWIAGACGSIDRDDAADFWIIGSVDGQVMAGPGERLNIRAGEPFNVWNDAGSDTYYD